METTHPLNKIMSEIHHLLEELRMLKVRRHQFSLVKYQRQTAELIEKLIRKVATVKYFSSTQGLFCKYIGGKALSIGLGVAYQMPHLLELVDPKHTALIEGQVSEATNKIFLEELPGALGILKICEPCTEFEYYEAVQAVLTKGELPQ